MNPAYAALAARLRQWLQDIDRVVRRAEFLLEQAQRRHDDGYLDGVALNLHGFYGGASMRPVRHGTHTFGVDCHFFVFSHLGF